MQQHEVKAAELQVHVRPMTRGLDAIRKDPAHLLASDPIADWDEFDAEIATAPVNRTALDLLQQVASLMRDAARLLTGLETIR